MYEWIDAGPAQLKSGEVARFEINWGFLLDPLSAVMIPSANNIARLLARWDAGSEEAFVKKIEGVGAGRLIDECGLKGHVHPRGTAEIFHRHANIIVNLGGATAADVRDLIELAQTTVRERLGQTLEPEIGFIGAF